MCDTDTASRYDRVSLIVFCSSNEIQFLKIEWKVQSNYFWPRALHNLAQADSQLACWVILVENLCESSTALFSETPTDVTAAWHRPSSAHIHTIGIFSMKNTNRYFTIASLRWNDSNKTTLQFVSWFEQWAVFTLLEYLFWNFILLLHYSTEVNIVVLTP